MKRFITYIICAAACLQSCLDIKLENQFSDPHAITTVATARELLASAYSSLPRYQLELSLLGDDFMPTSLSSRASNLMNIYNWTEKDMVELSTYIWNDYYMVIAYINALLPRLDNVTAEEEDAAELAKVRAEALGLKAWCYFDLLRLYSPVYSEANLKKSGIIIKNRLELDFLPRSTMEACIAEIDRLLGEAAKTANDSPVYYLGSDAVAAIRAEFEMYRGRYDKAVEYGLPLLSDIESRLSGTAFNNLWSDNASDERLFAPYIFDSFYIDLNYDRNTGDYFKISDAVTYQDGDQRKEWCEFQGPMEGTRSFGKYNRMYFDNTEVRYINSLRYSGVLLTVAEAYARDGKPAEARGLMDKYLTARGLTGLDSSLDGEALIVRILEEKHREFVGEGVRYFDLKRTGAGLQRYDAKGKETKKVASDDYKWLLPIPQSEYKHNDMITEADQNPGWPYEKTS